MDLEYQKSVLFRQVYVFSCKIQHSELVCISVLRYVYRVSLSALYSKNLQATHTWKFLLYQTLFCGYPYEKKSKNLVIPPLRTLLGHPVQKIILLHQKDLQLQYQLLPITIFDIFQGDSGGPMAVLRDDGRLVYIFVHLLQCVFFFY